MMKANLANSTVNYNKNLSILREKVSQDLYLRNSIYNINNRKPHYGINKNIYMIYTVKSKNKKAKKNNGQHQQNKSISGSQQASSRQGSQQGSRSGSRKGSGAGSRCGSPSKRSSNTFSYSQTQPNRISNGKVRYKYKLRKDDYLEGLNKQKMERQKLINLENERLKNRIKRISSPYSPKTLRKDSLRNSRMMQMRRQVRSNEELKSQSESIKTQLPKIFIRSKGGY